MPLVMYTGGNMNSVPLNATTGYPVTPTTPGSDFGTMLMVLQILFGTKKLDQQPEQNLETIPNITWSQGNFVVYGQPNPKESKTTHEEHNDVSKIIKKREVHEPLTAEEDFLHKNHAEEDEKDRQPETDAGLSEIRDHTEEASRVKATAEEDDCCDFIAGLQALPIPPTVGDWQHVTLLQNFGPGSKIVLRGRSKLSAPSLAFNLQYSRTIALHIDNRWSAAPGNALILNTFDNVWGPEQVYRPAQVNQGANFVITIECLDKALKICINDAFFTTYTHRVSPSMINQFSVMNAADISAIYYRGST